MYFIKLFKSKSYSLYEKKINVIFKLYLSFFHYMRLVWGKVESFVQYLYLEN